jgi:hypothetical protein
MNFVLHLFYPAAAPRVDGVHEALHAILEKWCFAISGVVGKSPLFPRITFEWPSAMSTKMELLALYISNYGYLLLEKEKYSCNVFSETTHLHLNS